MAFFSPTPVLSIVVPHTGRDAAFESSLVSVLENRPSECEVIVCHDGSYPDPFDLGDEVRFVISERGDLPSQVLAAARSAQGRLLHVLGDGHRATAGWTDAIVDGFEDESRASIAPVIVHPCEALTAAIGWTGNAATLCAAVAAGKPIQKITRRHRAAVDGAYLNASFWRCDVLRALDQLPTAGDAQVAAVLWTRAAQAVGLRCHSEPGSQVIADETFAEQIQVGAATARHLQSIATISGGQSALRGGLLGWLTSLHRLSAWGAAYGRTSAAWSDGAFQQRLRRELPQAVAALRSLTKSSARPAILQMPQRIAAPSSSSQRRAA